jgi:HAD superfamily hydrolase (TIGR01509 family)
MAAGAIFDIDGTLIDSVDLHARAWQEAMSRFGFDLPLQRIRTQIGKGADQLMPALLPGEFVQSRGAELSEFRSALFQREYLDQVRPFPCVRELFQRLRADEVQIALASSANGDELTHYRRLLDVDGLLHGATSSSDAERSKPHPDIFEAALEELGVERRAAIVIGDTPYDAQAADKARLRTIGMLAGGWPEDELRAAGCIAVYRDPEDLLRRYDASPLPALAASPSGR